MERGASAFAYRGSGIICFASADSPRFPTPRSSKAPSGSFQAPFPFRSAGLVRYALSRRIHHDSENCENGENGVHKVYRVALHRRNVDFDAKHLEHKLGQDEKSRYQGDPERFVGHPRFPVYSKHANHLSNKALKTALATREATAAATASFQAAKSSFGSLSASSALSLKIAHVLENEVHLRVARIDGPRFALHGFMIVAIFSSSALILYSCRICSNICPHPPFPRGSAASESHSRQA